MERVLIWLCVQPSATYVLVALSSIHPMMEANTCEMCGSNEAKYRCPGCNKRTCSLGCVKAHKAKDKCDGRRCKTAYVSQSEFSDNHLLSDYRFLEEVGSYVDSINRDGVARSHKSCNGLNLRRFKNACKRRNISFLYQNSIMTKRIENSSSYNRKRDVISWRVDWIFADVNDTHFTDHRVCENIPLKVLLDKYLHPTESDPVIRHRLQKYLLAGGVDNVEVFMKVQWKQLKGARYHKMDVSQGLRENLSYKTVIEYPTLHVCIGQSSSTHCYVAYEYPVNHEYSGLHHAISDPLSTSCKGDGGILGDEVPVQDRKGTELNGYSAIKQYNTAPHPHTLEQDCEDRKDHVINSNALELLIGQYCDSDTELEPGEVL